MFILNGRVSLSLRASGAFLVGVVCIKAIFSELFLALHWLERAIAILRLQVVNFSSA